MFYTKTKGIGGRLRQRIKDFEVEEIPLPIFPLHEKKQGKKYTIFWMEKFNWDTQGALMEISKRCNVPISNFHVAGTKDKRAITRQIVSTTAPKEVLSKIKIRGISLYGFSKGKKLKLGDLEGNKFKITIRDVKISKEEAEKRIRGVSEELKEGIPNFFGPQRFGVTRPVTHLVGKELLKGNVEEALKIYLCKVFPGEHEKSKRARKFLGKNWNERGFKKALEVFPRNLKYERFILAHLSKKPSDFEGAFRRLPKNLRKMFPNAVQSWIFNRTLKKLWPIEGEIPLVGFDTALGKDNISGLIRKILREEKLKLSDFRLKSIKDMRCSGGFRSAKLVPKNISWEIRNDEINKGRIKVVVCFTLLPGNYATVVLNEIMKNSEVNYL